MGNSIDLFSYSSGGGLVNEKDLYYEEFILVRMFDSIKAILILKIGSLHLELTFEDKKIDDFMAKINQINLEDIKSDESRFKILDGGIIKIRVNEKEIENPNNNELIEMCSNFCNYLIQKDLTKKILETYMESDPSCDFSVTKIILKKD